MFCAPPSDAKLAQLKKAHTKLMEKYTDLELEYHVLKSQLETTQTSRAGTFFHADEDRRAISIDTSDPEYDVIGEYESSLYGTVSTSEPSIRPSRHPIHALGVLPDTSRDTVSAYTGMPVRPSQRSNSLASRSTGTPMPNAYNQSAPLTREETKSAWSERSGGSGEKKAKIQADSNVRVYGRGGAQNIKLKQKEGQNGNGDGDGTKKTGGLRGLRKLV